jgi:hypothetical protein
MTRWANTRSLAAALKAFCGNKTNDIIFPAATHHAVGVGRDFGTALRIYLFPMVRNVAMTLHVCGW